MVTHLEFLSEKPPRPQTLALSAKHKLINALFGQSYNWQETSSRIDNSENMHDAQDRMVDVFFDLAVARILQLDRQIDIELFRTAMAGTASCNTKAAGKITPYRKSAAVSGEIVGKDARGFPYKRWKLIKPEFAREILKRHKIRPFKLGAIEIIQKLDIR